MRNTYPTSSAKDIDTHLGESGRDLLRLAGRRVDVQNRSLRLLGRNISAGHPSLPDSSGGEKHEFTYDGQLVRRHIFPNDGTFTIDRSAPVDVLLVSGVVGEELETPIEAGVVLVGSSLSVIISFPQVVIQSPSERVCGSTEENGGDSHFDGLTAFGGGGVDSFHNGFDGGSGGGAGGTGVDGGSSSKGEPAGDGGTGLSQVSVNDTTHRFINLFGTSYGEVVDGEVFFAGGGAGGSTDGPDGVGGSGGGGDADEDGILNTGGGGGQRSVGASGIVIILVQSQ